MMQRSLSAISSPHLGDVGMQGSGVATKAGNLWEKYGKQLGKVWKTWKNYGKTMGQVWNNNGILIYGNVYGKNGETMGT